MDKILIKQHTGSSYALVSSTRGSYASTELSVRSGKEGTRQSGSVGNGPMGLLVQLPERSGGGWGCKFSHRWSLLLSPPLSPQQDSDITASQKWIHTTGGVGVGATPSLELGREYWIPARGSGVYKRKPGHGNPGCDFDNYCVHVNFPTSIIVPWKKMPLLSK